MFELELSFLQFPLFRMHFICLDFFKELKLKVEPFYSGCVGDDEDVQRGSEADLGEILDFAFFAAENKNTKYHPLIKSRGIFEFFKTFSMKESGADVMKKFIM